MHNGDTIVDLVTLLRLFPDVANSYVESTHTGFELRRYIKTLGRGPRSDNGIELRRQVRETNTRVQREGGSGLPKNLPFSSFKDSYTHESAERPNHSHNGLFSSGQSDHPTQPRIAQRSQNHTCPFNRPIRAIAVTSSPFWRCPSHASRECSYR